METLLLNILGSILGTVIVLLWKSKDHMGPDWDSEYWWNDNRYRLLWTNSLSLILNLTFFLFPTSVGILALLGFTPEYNALANASPVLLGAVIMFLLYKKDNTNDNE